MDAAEPKFSTQWEREDHERQKRGEGPLGNAGGDFRWLIEAPGQHYLGARKLGAYEFYWTTDHNKALCFKSREQAYLTMMAIRGLAPSLFGFAVTLGDARAVEHGWMK